jgi:hypothetical protein
VETAVGKYMGVVYCHAHLDIVMDNDVELEEFMNQFGDD